MTQQDAGKQDDSSQQVCSTKDAAKLLGVSHRTVQLWVESGQLQAWKTAGGHRRISLASVEAMVARRDPAAAAARDAAPAVKTVLVVDDDPSMRRLYQLELDGWGLPLRLVLASDGFEALIRIGELRPDLLISDLNMPGMDGFRMIRRLRSDDAGRALSIIVVSGMDRESIAALALPADIPVFAKPVAFGLLRAAVEAALK